MLLQARRVARGWVLISGGILLVLVGMMILAPEIAGWVSGGLWAVLIVLPLAGYAMIGRLVAQERFRQASRLASWVRWLHPLDGLFEYPALLRGLELGQRGRVDEAIRLFEQHQAKTTIGNTARALLYRIGARWEDAITWVQQSLSEKVAFKDISVALIYLRSLGEVGDLNGLLHAVERFEHQFGPWGDTASLSLGRMFALAFCGQTEEVRQLFEGPLSNYSNLTHQYWLATAEWAAGNQSFARQQFLALQQRSDSVQNAAIAWRLSQPPIDLDQVLDLSSRKILIRLRVETGQESHYSLRQAYRGRKTYVTYLLIAANLLMFGWEVISGGSDNPETLYSLGALVPEVVFAGEWWRVVTANFLHLNFLHLLANMVGLYILGRFIETVLGAGRFLLIYGFSGVGAMLTVAIVAVIAETPIFVVGASGAVMGLLGAMGAIFLRGWQQEKAQVAGKQLLWLLALIGLQVISDLLIPESSLVGHLSGLSLGFLAGYLLSYRLKQS
jgi:rhomboid protease GluP